jgi:hypothetical protein
VTTLDNTFLNRKVHKILVKLCLEVLLGLGGGHGLLLLLLLHKVLDELVDVEEVLRVEDGHVAAHGARVT